MKNSINNVINFLSNNKFNKNTIIDDINTSIDLLFNNSSYYLLNDLRNSLSVYLSRRAEEAVNFIRFIYENNIDNPIIYNLFEKYNLPFIDSRYALADQLILSRLYDKEDISLSEAIYLLACFKDKYYIEHLEVKELLHTCLDVDAIDFGAIGYGRMFGKMDNYDESDEEIIDNMESLKMNPNKNNHNSIVAHYAELVAYKHLDEQLRPGQKLYWVSRDIGDGFGYDMAIINEDNSAILYEVKGLHSRNFADITPHESNVYHYSNRHSDLSYHYLVVLTNDNDVIIDITNTNNGTLYSFNGDNNYDASLNELNRRILVKKE